MDFPFHPRSGARHQFRPIVNRGSPLGQRFYPILYGNNWGSYRPHLPPQYQRYPTGQIGRFQTHFYGRTTRGENASHPVHKTERILRTSVDNEIDTTKFLSPSKVKSETSSNITSKGKPKKEVTNRDKNQSKKVAATVAGNSEGESSMEKENRNNVANNSPATPQYRIFKRGDLAGLSCPLELITGMNIQQSDEGSSCNFVKAEQRNEPANVMAGSPEQIEKQQESASESKTGSNRTATSLVTDIARFHGLNPEYRLINEEGPPHAPTFTIVLTLGEEQYEATGPSIKKAQLAAATKAVELTKLLRPPPRGQPRKNNFRNLKPIGSGPNSKRLNWSVNQLNAFAGELNQKVVFSTQSPNYSNGINGGGVSIVRVQVGEKCFIGEGKNVQAAKNSAVQQALNALIALKQEIELAKMLESNGSNTTELLDSSIKSPISIVHEMSLKRGKKVSFEVIKEEGPPHMKLYAIKCIVGDIETQGCGPTKQAAKKASCEEMIEKLKEVPMKQPKISSLKLMQNGLCTKPKVVRKKPAAPVIKEVDKQVVSPISRLLHIAHVRKYKEPEFVVIKQADDVPPEVNPQKPDKRAKKKKPFFTMQVTVGPFTCEGSGPNKKAAKKVAADNALIALGYAPSAPAKEHQSSVPSTTDSSDSGSGAQPVKDKKPKNLKITSARQIVPGVLMIKSEDADEPPVTSAIPAPDAPLASHANSGIIKSSTPVPSAVAPMEGIRKLDYLVQLLDLAVSYTNFPKKEGFLSVAILSSNPPRMAHGFGPTVEAAQNAAAMEILAELATTGLDSVNTGLSNVNDVKPTIQS